MQLSMATCIFHTFKLVESECVSFSYPVMSRMTTLSRAE